MNWFRKIRKEVWRMKAVRFGSNLSTCSLCEIFESKGGEKHFRGFAFINFAGLSEYTTAQQENVTSVSQTDDSRVAADWPSVSAQLLLSPSPFRAQFPSLQTTQMCILSPFFSPSTHRSTEKTSHQTCGETFKSCFPPVSPVWNVSDDRSLTASFRNYLRHPTFSLVTFCKRENEREEGGGVRGVERKNFLQTCPWYLQPIALGSQSVLLGQQQ